MFNHPKELIIESNPSVSMDISLTCAENKKIIYQALYETQTITLAILIQEDNLPKLEFCINSLKETTKGHSFSLQFYLNGDFSQELKDYIASVSLEGETERLPQVEVTSPQADCFSSYLAMNQCQSRYLLLIRGDVVLTSGWLDSLLSCGMSSPQVGMVSTLNEEGFLLENPSLFFDSIEDLQEQSKSIYKKDPKKWEESLYIPYPQVLLIKKEVLDDTGYYDLSLADPTGDYVQRGMFVGYSHLICHDTFFLSLSGTAPSIEATENTEESFQSRYHMSFYGEYLAQNQELLLLLQKEAPKKGKKFVPSVLGIDMGAGATFLGIKNYFRFHDILNPHLHAFTSDPTYFNQLQILTHGHSHFGESIEDLSFPDRSFDYIFVGKPLQSYKEVSSLLKKLYTMGNIGCKFFFTLENVQSFLYWREFSGKKSQNPSLTLPNNAPFFFYTTYHLLADLKDCGFSNLTKEVIPLFSSEENPSSFSPFASSDSKLLEEEFTSYWKSLKDIPFPAPLEQLLKEHKYLLCVTK